MTSIKPNHDLDNESRFGEILGILTVGCLLSTVVVVARVFTRLKILRTFGSDDAVMAVAQVLTIGSAIAEGLESKWGLGSHVWTVKEEDNIPYMKSFYSSILVYNIAVCLVKISILLQYRRIFTGRIIQRLALVGLVFLAAWTVTLAFLLSLVCIPVAAFWDPTVEGRCLPFLLIWYVMAGVNLVTDFAIFSLPLPVINSLQLPRRQKMMLLIVFGLGFFTCAISIIRIRTLRVAAETQDPTWDNVDAATWSFLELTIGVLAACLPTLRPIFVKIMPRLFGNSTAASGTGGGYGSGYPRHNSAWQRSQASTHKGARTTVKDSESTEELHYRGDMEIGLRDMGRNTEAQEGTYSFAVSGGYCHSDVEMDQEKEQLGEPARHSGGIKATTTITQRIDFNDGEKKIGMGYKKESSEC